MTISVRHLAARNEPYHESDSDRTVPPLAAGGYIPQSYLEPRCRHAVFFLSPFLWQFVDQFIQISYFLHERLGNLLHTHAADTPLYLLPVGV